MKTVSHCLFHEECEHEVTECDCPLCWTHQAQCTGLYDVLVLQNVGVDRAADAKGEVPDHNQQDGDNDLYCTETLRDTVVTGRTPRKNLKVSIGKAAFPGRESTQLSFRSGTSEPVGFHFPSVGSFEWKRYISQLNEHIESENKKNTPGGSHRYLASELYGDENMDSAGERGQREPSVHDDGKGGGPGDSDTKSAVDPGEAERREGAMGQQAAESVSDIFAPSSTGGGACSPGTIIPETPEKTPKRKRRSDCKTPKAPKKQRGDDGPTESGGRRPASESGGSSRGAGKFQYHTFVIHKSNQEDDWKSKAAKKTGPQFITFDHGDHYHVIYGSSQENNIARQRQRISKYLRATSAGAAEITLTSMRIRLLRNFVLYCVRYGLESFHFYGTRITPEFKDLERLVHQIRDEGLVEYIETGECKRYIEDRKEEKNARIGEQKRGVVVEVIEQLLEENAIRTLAEWELKLDAGTKSQLLRDFGLQADTYAARIIKNNKFRSTSKYKYMTYEDILIDNIYNGEDELWETDFAAPQIKRMRWIENLFVRNELDIVEFFAWLSSVKNQTFIKINTLVLEGHTNAGKSLTIDGTVGPLKPEEIPRERDNTGFHLDQLPFAACALFEEPMITPVNVGTWKLLLEGKRVSTDIKHKDKEAIERLPIFITTASPIQANVDTREGEQLCQRIKIFKFKATISHRSEAYTLTHASGGTIPKAPGYIKPGDFGALFVLKYKEIRARQRSDEASLQLNPQRLKVSVSTAEELEKWSEIWQRDLIAKSAGLRTEESNTDSKS